jgi:hypothetical protein
MAIKTEEIENKHGFYVVANLVNDLGQTAANYGIVFTACRPCEVLEVKQVHGTASTSGTVNVERLTSTTAKGSGDNVLATAFSTAGTANTVLTKDRVDLQNRQLSAGDRLAIVSGGTLTNLLDLQVTIYLKPLGRGDYR